MVWPFSQARVAPAKVPTDTVIPLHSFDDTDINRSILLVSTLRFDDVMDTEKLRQGLVRLMELGNWRKLGARIRLNGSGKLEYHVPVTFDEKRPGFSYSHVKYDIKIKDHPLASRLPKMTTSPSLQGNPRDFMPLARRPDGPTQLDDYLYSDEPQLSVHIVSFEDSTLVSLTWVHTLWDAMGRSIFFAAWSSVVNGKEDQVPDLYGFNEDPLASFGSTATEEAILAKHEIKGFTFFIIILRYLFELFWFREEEMRVISLPASYIKSLKEDAMEELASQNPNSQTKPYLSDGDILSAWWTRMVVQNFPQIQKSTILISNVFGLRGILSRDLLPANTVYVSNACLNVLAMMNATTILNKPLSHVASLVRQSIVEQGMRAQAEAFAKLCRTTLASSGHPPIFGDRTSVLVTITNWTRAKFFDVDFSAAVTQTGVEQEEDRTGRPGRPSYVQAFGYVKKFSLRGNAVIFGKDGKGNYWMSATMRTSFWSSVERSLAAM